jgi:hypothetical protein
MNLMEDSYSYSDCYNALKKRILTLSTEAWEGYPKWTSVENWLNNFNGLTGNTEEDERLHALFILSEFLYFGSRQIRALLQAMYREHFIIPLIQKIRKNNNDTREIGEINKHLAKEIELTRFLGIGNPSESGIHLLYYFRQENDLPSSLFCDIATVLTIKEDENKKMFAELSNPEILRYIFIDDMCGTGKTAKIYSEKFLLNIKNVNSNIEFHYLSLFGTSFGINEVKQNTVFKENCSALFELDDSYKILSEDSRYFAYCPEIISKEIINNIVKKYGISIWKEHPHGYGDSQLVLGMHHNIPNNTIPIIWWESDDDAWNPIFKRYKKNKGITL